MILVIAEQREGVLNNASLEVVAAAQEVAQGNEDLVKVAVVGSNVGLVGEDLASASVAEVLVVDDPSLEPYSADGFVDAVTQLIDAESPEIIFFLHSYQIPMLLVKQQLVKGLTIMVISRRNVLLKFQ